MYFISFYFPFLEFNSVTLKHHEITRLKHFKNEREITARRIFPFRIPRPNVWLRESRKTIASSILYKLLYAKVNQIATRCDGPACSQLASGPSSRLCY